MGYECEAKTFKLGNNLTKLTEEYTEDTISF